PRARWTGTEAQRLTLKFLGEVDPNDLIDLAARLRPALALLPAARVHFQGGGFFPSEKRPRVAWIGGAHSGVLPVVESIEASASSQVFLPETRPWFLHLTQARLNRPWPSWAAERFLNWAEGLRLKSVAFTEVVLFSSDLRPTGAVYTALERFSLA
ncbi:MAG: RNA 2',3'-cyclic phosphodiesterase, partial [Thermoanaerobaculales bacterium]|nr:RNA 2',3'-cyclic phosphodiesterase [Thermoanaerobaculales bacterium]